MKATNAKFNAAYNVLFSWWHFYFFWLLKRDEVNTMTTANIPEDIVFWKA